MVGFHDFSRQFRYFVMCLQLALPKEKRDTELFKIAQLDDGRVGALVLSFLRYICFIKT